MFFRSTLVSDLVFSALFVGCMAAMRSGEKERVMAPAGTR
jgi:hypothetical protein